MSIAKPGRRLLHHVRLPFVRRKVAGGGRRTINASLSLTSMIDFLIVAVVFLLVTFNPGESALARGVTLPPATNTLDAIDAPTVTVVGSQILVDGNAAGTTRQVEEQRKIAPLEELAAQLRAKRETWKALHPGAGAFPGMVSLQIDQDTPSLVVKSVFQTAATAGYPNVGFVVQKQTR